MARLAQGGDSRIVIPFEGSDVSAAYERIGEARYVLIGEATHGTHEFYQYRAELTRRLIAGKGFRAVAIEGDWPDAYRVNEYVMGNRDRAVSSLGDFKRFPAWMWRNTVVLNFIEWLREWNDRMVPIRRAGFYGLDLYSLHRSMQKVIEYLKKKDPAAADRAIARYGCFGPYGDDSQAYGYAAEYGLTEGCEKEVAAQLADLREHMTYYASSSPKDAEQFFSAEQNARLVKNAEHYYRSMFSGRVSSWNVRDRHMAETLETLSRHLEKTGPVRVVVWAHNSHLGDAAATQMGDRGEINIGNLSREAYPGDTVLIGFTTWSGTVTAADDWDGEGHMKRVRPAIEGSYEELFHRMGHDRFLIDLREHGEIMPETMLERAIGVIYRPRTERMSHYFEAEIAKQFDLLIHVDETTALAPLDKVARHEIHEAPETYPSGM